MSAAGFRLPGGEADADRLRAVERELADTQAAFAASQQDLTAATDNVRALKVALLATRAELATALQELKRLRPKSTRTEETKHV